MDKRKSIQVDEQTWRRIRLVGLHDGLTAGEVVKRAVDALPMFTAPLVPRMDWGNQPAVIGQWNPAHPIDPPILPPRELTIERDDSSQAPPRKSKP